jgi:hypothetical protein
MLQFQQILVLGLYHTDPTSISTYLGLVLTYEVLQFFSLLA